MKYIIPILTLWIAALIGCQYLTEAIQPDPHPDWVQVEPHQQQVQKGQLLMVDEAGQAVAVVAA